MLPLLACERRGAAWPHVARVGGWAPLRGRTQKAMLPLLACERCGAAWPHVGHGRAQRVKGGWVGRAVTAKPWPFCILLLGDRRRRPCCPCSLASVVGQRGRTLGMGERSELRVGGWGARTRHSRGRNSVTKKMGGTKKMLSPCFPKTISLPSMYPFAKSLHPQGVF